MEQRKASSGPSCVGLGSLDRRLRLRSSNRRQRRYSDLSAMWSMFAVITLLLSQFMTADAALFYPPPSQNLVTLKDGNYTDKNPYNCLDAAVKNTAKALQWRVLAVSVVLNRSSSANNLNVTVYGNVTGEQFDKDLPSFDDTKYWENRNESFGKIDDQDRMSGLQSTLFTKVEVLNYIPFNDVGKRFCENVLNTECPMAPVFR